MVISLEAISITFDDNKLPFTEIGNLDLTDYEQDVSNTEEQPEQHEVLDLTKNSEDSEDELPAKRGRPKGAKNKVHVLDLSLQRQTRLRGIR